MNQPQSFLGSVLFFDLDNTILQGPFESIVFPIIFNLLSQQAGIGFDEARSLVVGENFARQNNPNTPAILAMDWDEIVQSVASKLHVHLANDIVLNIITSHLYPPFLVMLDDARDVLLSLKSQDRRIVAATKGLRKYQFPLLKALDLLSVFEQIITPDCSGVLKSDIRFYGDWPHMTGVQIIVGDHWQDDVVAPKSFGFKSVWRLTHTTNVPTELVDLTPFQRSHAFRYSIGALARPDAIILDLHELLDLIPDLER